MAHPLDPDELLSLATMELADIFASQRSGVAQVVLERDRQGLTAGSAFLVSGGLVTNSHVLREMEFEVAGFRFDDMRGNELIRLSRDDCLAALAYESPSEEHDVAYLRLNLPEFQQRHVFEFSGFSRLRVGQKIAFLGYPFQMTRLTCHVGYVSSTYERNGVFVVQIDASVNGGNSGGPLIEIESGRVAAVVTCAHVGFVAEQFDELIRTLRKNVELLSKRSGKMRIGGVDLVAGLRASQVAMAEIAVNLRKSANVGIGFAFGVDQIREQVERLSAT